MEVFEMARSPWASLLSEGFLDWGKIYETVLSWCEVA